MTKSAARMGDKHSCPKAVLAPHHGGTIKAGSPNVTFGGQPAARVADKTDHDGQIMTGMATVTIADSEPFIEIGDTGIIEIGDNVIFGG